MIRNAVNIVAVIAIIYLFDDGSGIGMAEALLIYFIGLYVARWDRQ